MGRRTGKDLVPICWLPFCPTDSVLGLPEAALSPCRWLPHIYCHTCGSSRNWKPRSVSTQCATAHHTWKPKLHQRLSLRDRHALLTQEAEAEGWSLSGAWATEDKTEKDNNCKLLLKMTDWTNLSSPNHLKMQSETKKFCKLGSRRQAEQQPNGQPHAVLRQSLGKLRNTWLSLRRLASGGRCAWASEQQCWPQRVYRRIQKAGILAQASNPSLQEAAARGLRVPSQLKLECK